MAWPQGLGRATFAFDGGRSFRRAIEKLVHYCRTRLGGAAHPLVRKDRTLTPFGPLGAASCLLVKFSNVKASPLGPAALSTPFLPSHSWETRGWHLHASFALVSANSSAASSHSGKVTSPKAVHPLAARGVPAPPSQSDVFAVGPVHRAVHCPSRRAPCRPRPQARYGCIP